MFGQADLRDDDDAVDDDSNGTDKIYLHTDETKRLSLIQF